MDATQSKFAYRCLPMAIANQSSWDVLSPSDVKATWNGDNSPQGVNVEILDKDVFHFASSLFGWGVLTFHVDFIIRTNTPNSIYVKGPSNSHKNYIQPLEGIVETFWLPFTFTMNWKFTEPSEISFKKDEPLFSFFPVDLNYLESFTTNTINIDHDPVFACKYHTYDDSRTDHVNNGNVDWQKYYMQGVEPFIDKKHPEHKSKVKLKEF
jgi:hypothetical protein